MIAIVETLKSEESLTINLGEGDFQIKDTISDWVISNSNEVIVGVFDKFNTLSIILVEKEDE